MNINTGISGILKAKNALQILGIVGVIGIAALVMLGGSSEETVNINQGVEQAGDGTNEAEIQLLLDQVDELE